MKISKYNVSFFRNEKYIIFNTYMGCQYTSDIPLEELEHQLNIGELRREKIDELVKLGIITNDNNEFKSALDKLEKFRNSDKYLHLMVYVTDECNSSCVYCPQKKEVSFFSNDDINRLIKFVSNKITEIKYLNVEWFGGEPLMVLNTIVQLSRAFIALCIGNNVTYTSGITTNATLLDKRTFYKLTQLHVLNYQITLDGFENVHNAQRPLKNGKNSYNIILKNLFQIRDNYIGKVDIIIRVNISKLSFDDLDHFFDFLYESFGSDERFSFLLRIVNNWGGEKIESFKDNLLSVQSFEYVYKLAKRKHLQLLDKSLAFGIGSMVCGASKKNFYGVDVGCKLYKCILFKDDQSLIGQIDDKGNINVYNNEKLSIWKNANNRTEKCITCKSAPQCMGYQCPLNNLLGEKYNCQDFYFTSNNRYKTIL